MIKRLHDLASGEDVHKKIDELINATNIQTDILTQILYQLTLIRSKQVSQKDYFERLGYIRQFLDRL